MSFLPGGTLTFLFTDIEGSTKLWEQSPDAMRAALARHDELLRRAIAEHQGIVFKTVGDAFCAVFAVASAALQAALALQQALTAEPWGDIGTLKARAALHTGNAQERDNDYFGPELNRVARLLALGYGGQILLSQTAYDLARDYLPPNVSLRDLGTHRLKDLLRPEHVYQVVAPNLPTEFPALKSLDALPTNLPQQASSFIGREQEMRDVVEALWQTRLLTLTGSGGTGKTRLSLQVAADALEQFPDGVWLIELAALKDPLLVPSAFASALLVKEEPGRELTDTLTDHLKDKNALLVVDNCEHLVDACALLAEALLRQCPCMRLLASSREALRISGETVYRVPPLALPDLQRLPDVEILTQYEAVRLFIERALAVQPTFQVHNHNAPAVAQICSRLDGIPLAIELAAARVRMLSPEQISARLDDRFKLLTGGSRTALPRQQTLKALIDWSYRTLSEEEQALFARLSVFSGGWTLEAAESLCEEKGESDSAAAFSFLLSPFDALDILTLLVDKSLAIYDDSGAEPRYRMLETLRQYGQERLREAGETSLAQARHCDWFLQLSHQAEPHLMSGEQQAWLEVLEREHDNLRSALDWSLAHRNFEAACRMTYYIWRFWMMRGYLSEGRRRVQTLLNIPDIPRLWSGRLALVAGNLAYIQGDLPAAEARYQSAVEPLQTEGNQKQLAALFSNMAVLTWQQGELETAANYAAQSLELRRELQDRHGIATSLNSLGNITRSRGDFHTAWQQFAEAETIYRQLGDQHSLAIALYNLAAVALEQEDYNAARAHLEESLSIRETLDDKQGVAAALLGLGSVFQNTGQQAQAQACFERSLATDRELGNTAGELASLYNLGTIAMEWQDWQTARRLILESLRLCEATGENYIFWGALQSVAALFLHYARFAAAAQLIAATARSYPAAQVPASPAARKLDLLRQQARNGLEAEAFAQATLAGEMLTWKQMLALARQSEELS